jgi:hypothetical protein
MPIYLETGEFYHVSFLKSRALTRSAHERQRVMKVVTGSLFRLAA